MNKSGYIATVKQGLGLYLADFYTNYFEPDTAACKEWATRGLAKSMQFAAGRMIDNADGMMDDWRKNNNSGKKGTSAFLPNVIVAMGKDYTPALGEYSNQLPEWSYFIFPQDAQERIFKLRVMQGDIRIQLAIFAAEEASARSIAMQFCSFVKSLEHRTFGHQVEFASMFSNWPVQTQTPDVSVIPIAMAEQTNLTVMTVDLMLRASIPVFRSPRAGEVDDGKGAAGTPQDPLNPAGYKPMMGVNIQSNMSGRTYDLREPTSAQTIPTYPRA